MVEVSYSQKYYNANRDKILQYQQDYYCNKKQKRRGDIRIKHGSFVLFGPTPCVIDWNSPCNCSYCSTL